MNTNTGKIGNNVGHSKVSGRTRKLTKSERENQSKLGLVVVRMK